MKSDIRSLSVVLIVLRSLILIKHRRSFTRGRCLIDKAEGNRSRFGSMREWFRFLSSSKRRCIDTRHATPLETLSECGICCETRRLPKRHCCPFYACSTCLNIYVEEQIRLGIIRIPCPNQQCQAYMHRDEINKRCLSPELRQRLTRFVVDANRAINVKTCPRCSNIHEIGLNERSEPLVVRLIDEFCAIVLDLELCRSKRRAPTKVQCVECNLIWCFQCHSPWHDGIQCREFRRGDRMLKKWAREVHYGQQNAQQCPSCKVQTSCP